MSHYLQHVCREKCSRTFFIGWSTMSNFERSTCVQHTCLPIFHLQGQSWQMHKMNVRFVVQWSKGRRSIPASPSQLSRHFLYLVPSSVIQNHGESEWFLCNRICESTSLLKGSTQNSLFISKIYQPITATDLAISCCHAWSWVFVSFPQNLVMFLGLIVAWVIPDVPKTIVEQLKREKKLLVNLFLQEEKEKFQLIQSLFTKDSILQSNSQPSNPSQGLPILGRYSTLPSGPAAGDGGGGGPRARCRAASFSQFSGKTCSSPKNENASSRQTAVWHAPRFFDRLGCFTQASGL